MGECPKHQIPYTTEQAAGGKTFQQCEKCAEEERKLIHNLFGSKGPALPEDIGKLIIDSSEKRDSLEGLQRRFTKEFRGKKD